ncbi:hypothetical protein BDR05DRAFT_947917 [Suillus weaverae]|nr:hypothetical protein BDR05DRAFT_947917 [Suillus weaverae]
MYKFFRDIVFETCKVDSDFGEKFGLQWSSAIPGCIPWVRSTPRRRDSESSAGTVCLVVIAIILTPNGRVLQTKVRSKQARCDQNGSSYPGKPPRALSAKVQISEINLIRSSNLAAALRRILFLGKFIMEFSRYRSRVVRFASPVFTVANMSVPPSHLSPEIERFEMEADGAAPSEYGFGLPFEDENGELRVSDPDGIRPDDLISTTTPLQNGSHQVLPDNPLHAAASGMEGPHKRLSDMDCPAVHYARQLLSECADDDNKHDIVPPTLQDILEAERPLHAAHLQASAAFRRRMQGLQRAVRLHTHMQELRDQKQEVSKGGLDRPFIPLPSLPDVPNVLDNQVSEFYIRNIPNDPDTIAPSSGRHPQQQECILRTIEAAGGGGGPMRCPKHCAVSAQALPSAPVAGQSNRKGKNRVMPVQALPLPGTGLPNAKGKNHPIPVHLNHCLQLKPPPETNPSVFYDSCPSLLHSWSRNITWMRNDLSNGDPPSSFVFQTGFEWPHFHLTYKVDEQVLTASKGSMQTPDRKVYARYVLELFCICLVSHLMMVVLGDVIKLSYPIKLIKITGATINDVLTRCCYSTKGIYYYIHCFCWGRSYYLG